MVDIETDELLEKTNELVDAINKVMREGASTFTFKQKVEGTSCKYKWTGLDIETEEKMQVTFSLEMKKTRR